MLYVWFKGLNIRGIPYTNIKVDIKFKTPSSLCVYMFICAVLVCYLLNFLSYLEWFVIKNISSGWWRNFTKYIKQKIIQIFFIKLGTFYYYHLNKGYMQKIDPFIYFTHVHKRRRDPLKTRHYTPGNLHQNYYK